MKAVTFYHSMLCPRCHLANLAISRLARDFPEVRFEKVEMLTNRARAREDGVALIPALVSGGKKLSGVILTRKRIRQFLETV